jgi:hypothetical protein
MDGGLFRRRKVDREWGENCADSSYNFRTFLRARNICKLSHRVQKPVNVGGFERDQRGFTKILLSFENS